MNPIILPPAGGRIVGQTGPFTLAGQSVSNKEKSEFQPVKLRITIDRVSHPAREEGLGE